MNQLELLNPYNPSEEIPLSPFHLFFMGTEPHIFEPLIKSLPPQLVLSLSYLTLKNISQKIPIGKNKPLENPALIVIHENKLDALLIKCLEPLKSRPSNLKIIIFSDEFSVSLAQKAAYLKADLIVEKTIHVKEFTHNLAKLFSSKKLLNTTISNTSALIGDSPATNLLRNQIFQLAQTHSTVLITGESGTGKELVAQEIHRLSNRSQHPFVALNCAALPENLLESELFGHKKGSFTGAFQDSQGRFLSAGLGTLFLDEVGDMSLSLQAKLLRVLQEKQVRPIGSTKTYPLKARVLAATHKNLTDLITKGQFRLDLYYRLNVLPLKVKPLRERPLDIVGLADHFIKKFNKAHSSKVTNLTEETEQLLKDNLWPGNIRELENLFERILIFKKKGQIQVSDLPDHYRVLNFDNKNKIEIPPEGVHFYNLVTNFEKTLILKALEKTNGNKNQAAKLLHLNRTTLLEKMKKLFKEK